MFLEVIVRIVLYYKRILEVIVRNVLYYTDVVNFHCFFFKIGNPLFSKIGNYELNDACIVERIRVIISPGR